MPGSYSQDAATVSENQSYADVQVTQGDDPDLNYVVIIGSKEIPLPPGLPKGSPVRVVYEYDREQTVHIRLYAGGAASCMASSKSTVWRIWMNGSSILPLTR